MLIKKILSELAFTTTKPNGIIFELDEQGSPKGCKLYHSTEGILYCKYHKIEKKFSAQETKEE